MDGQDHGERRMRHVLPKCAKLVLGVALAAGCARVVSQKVDKSPLAAPRRSPDSVELEIFFVRAPLGDPEANETLWSELDEQALDPILRRGLAENGFRVGLAGSQMPAGVERLLGLEGRAPTTEEECLVNVDQDAKVCRRRLQIRAGRRSEIVASEVYDELPMLLRENGQLRGRSFAKGQGVLAVKTFPEGDGRVRLELVPELHFGESRQQWRGGEEMFYLESGRPREALDQLQVAATLAPGQMLVLASLPDRPGSLGHHFFTQRAGGEIEQKLLVIRVAQTQYDDLFTPDQQ
jgi:hypothetical protein